LDNLTHSLAGAVLGQMGLKTKTGLGMATLIIAANIPDIDAVATLLDGVQHLAIRRGITHGPIAMLILPLVLTGIMIGFDRWQGKRGKRPADRLPIHRGWLLALAYIGCLSHPALDWLNSYGIRLLEPFSSQWFYGDSIFIIDIWIWAALIAGFWISRRRENNGKSWRWPAIGTVVVVFAYILVNLVISAGSTVVYAINEKAMIDDGNGNYVSTRIPKDTIITSPIPLWSWRRELILGKKNNWFRIPADQLASPLNAVPITQNRCAWPNTNKLILQNSDLRAFLIWSRAPFAERADDGSILIRDARFYDPLARDRFTVKLTDIECDLLPVGKPEVFINPKS